MLLPSLWFPALGTTTSSCIQVSTTMKTSVFCAVFGALLVMWVSSVEGQQRNICSKPCQRLVAVRQLVSYRYFVWGRYYTFNYYTWVYRWQSTHCYVPCPINCEWNEWEYKAGEDWSPCSVTCGKGQETRPMVRTIKIQAAYGGKECTEPSERKVYQECDMKDCPATTCKKAKGGIGHFTHYQNCSKYVQCENGKPHVKPCPDGTAWDSIGDKQCSSEALHHCQGIACIRGMLLPHEEDCSKFYKCDHNMLIAQKCEDNRYWDIRVNRCVPDKTVCDMARESEDFQPEELTCDKEGEMVLSREHCNKYFVCSHFRLVERLCPPGTNFDPDTNECGHPKPDVRCTNDDEEEEPEEPEPCQNGQFLPVDGDPNAYYRCVHGNRVLLTCAAGLVFKGTGCVRA